MSLGKTGLATTLGLHGDAGIIAPRDEGFYTRPDRLIHPDEMKLGGSCIVECLEPQPLVMFIGGSRDDQYGNVLERIFIPYNSKHEGLQDIGYATFRTESSIMAIGRAWHAKGQPLCFIGHSFGGDAAMKVAVGLSAEDIEVELVVTLDPVDNPASGASQPKPEKLKRWLNVYVDYQDDKCKLWSPSAIAKKGGPWQFCRNADDNRTYRLSSDPCWSHAMAKEMFEESGYYSVVASLR